MKPLFALPLIAALATIPELSIAQCIPNTVGVGEVVTCSGSDTNGFANNAQDTIVIVLDTATVSNNGEAFEVGGSGTTLSNSGTIRSNNDHAVVIEGSGSSLFNSGAITGERDGVKPGTGSTVTNSGTIESATTQAIDARDFSNLTIVNSSSGIIQTSVGAEEAVRADTRLTLINDGSIIASADDAVQVTSDANIINRGVIRGASNDAMELTGGYVENSGEIISESSASGEVDSGIDFDASALDGHIVNSGTICGEIGIGVDNTSAGGENTGRQIIENSGTIQGTGGTAVLLGAGDDTVIVRPGGKFIGRIRGGRGNDTFFVDQGVSGTFTVLGFETIDIRPTFTQVGSQYLVGSRQPSLGAQNQCP